MWLPIIDEFKNSKEEIEDDLIIKLIENKIEYIIQKEYEFGIDLSINKNEKREKLENHSLNCLEKIEQLYVRHELYFYRGLGFKILLKLKQIYYKILGVDNH